MNKQEQIEEMAEAVVRSAIIANAKIDNKCAINLKEFIDNLYDAGYRKTFTSDLASDMQKAFKEGYEKGINEQQSEIERLKAENAKRLNAIEDFTAKKCYLKCAIAKTLVKEFAEQLKQKFNGYEDYYYDGEEGGVHDLDEEIDDLLETYGLDGKVNGINLRLGITQKDFEIITTALREYAKNHPNPKCHANEANDLAHLIEYQRMKIEE